MLFESMGLLCTLLHERNIHVTIETAGTVDREWPIDLLSLSPKLSNSTPVNDARDPDGRWARRHERVRKDLAPMLALLRRRGTTVASTQVKFVVQTEQDLEEIDALLKSLTAQGCPIEPSDVFLMPEGVCTPDPDAVRWVIEACHRRGFRYGHRLHIELFGHTRGT